MPRGAIVTAGAARALARRHPYAGYARTAAYAGRYVYRNRASVRAAGQSIASAARNIQRVFRGFRGRKRARAARATRRAPRLYDNMFSRHQLSYTTSGVVLSSGTMGELTSYRSSDINSSDDTFYMMAFPFLTNPANQTSSSIGYCHGGGLSEGSDPTTVNFTDTLRWYATMTTRYQFFKINSMTYTVDLWVNDVFNVGADINPGFWEVTDRLYMRSPWKTDAAQQGYSITDATEWIRDTNMAKAAGMEVRRRRFKRDKPLVAYDGTNQVEPAPRLIRVKKTIKNPLSRWRGTFMNTSDTMTDINKYVTPKGFTITDGVYNYGTNTAGGPWWAIMLRHHMSSSTDRRPKVGRIHMSLDVTFKGLKDDQGW